MTSRTRRTWIIYGLCVVALVAALGWTTCTLLRLEHAEQQARAEAERQERIRLALWRMESILAARLAEEGARPYFHYAPFYAPQRAYTRMLLPVEAGEVLVPSPLLTFSDPFIKLHFQVDDAGIVTSPQAPTGNLRDLAEASYTTHEAVAQTTLRLAHLKGMVSSAILGENSLAAFDNEAEQNEVYVRVQRKAEQILNYLPKYQARSTQEWETRFNTTQAAQQQVIARNAPSFMQQPKSNGTDEVRIGPFAPRWRRAAAVTGSDDDEWTLFLLRSVELRGQKLTQGLWADWPAIRAAFIEAIADLLPKAAVTPTDDPASCDPGLLLASVPAVLDPGPARPATAPLLTPVRGILGLSWLIVLAAVATVGAVLRAAVDLSTRRGEFVSAVTHELRTPLTTFRMYCEMLTEGMVTEEKVRQEYLATLQDESDHLSRLVENVLTYARVEQGRETVARRDRMTAGELIAQAASRAAERARRAGVELAVRVGNGSEDEVASCDLVTDPSAVEQILVNLVDNAIKYGCDANLHVSLSVSRAEGELRISVSDDGRGIDGKEAERIFKPFLRGSNSHGVTQGVGLGLAISRRLARDLGGDLRLEQRNAGGATFVLTLPIAGS